MPELLDLAREAMSKAKLFGNTAWQDFQQQDTEQQAQAQDPIGLIIQKLSSAPSGGDVAPSLEQSVSSGLGALGVPGGQDKGFFLKDTPIGNISLGPRELAGLVIGGLATPGGPAGKAEGVAAKASENIASRFASKMGAGAQRLASKSAERKAAQAAAKAEEEAGKTIVTELRPGERFASAPDAESLANALFGPEVGLAPEVTAEQAPVQAAQRANRPPTQGPSLEATIASRDAPPPRIKTPDPREQLAPSSQFTGDTIETEKRNLAKTKYESGLEDVPIEFDEQGNPTLPEGFRAPDISTTPEGPILKGKSGSSSREVTAEREDLGPTKQAADLAGVQEWERQIGQPRIGNKRATGLEAELDVKRTRDRAQQFLEDQAAQYGDNPLKSHAFHDWLTKFIYGSESKRGPGGEVIWQLDKAGKPIEKEGVKQPETVFRPLWRRVQQADQDEANGVISKGNKFAHGWITHQSPRPGVRKPFTLDKRTGPGWHETPAGRQWLAHEAIALATEPGGQFEGMTPKQIASVLVDKQANEMAGEATSIKTSRSDIRPSKLGTSDEPEGLATEDPGRAFGTGDTAHVSQADLESAGMSRMDPRKPMERQVDERSTDPLARQDYEFADDETRSRFFEIKGQKDSAQSLLQDYAKPDTAKKIGVPQAEIDKQIAHAQATVADADEEMAKILDVSSVADDAEREGMDQPQRFDSILIDPRTPITRRAARPLPEGMSATVHYSDPVTGRGVGKPLQNAEGPSRVNPSKTYTGEMPSTGLVTNTFQERQRQIEDKAVEYVQKQLSFLQDSGAFKGLSGNDKIKLIQQHVSQARRRAEISVNTDTGVEKQIRNPEAYTAAGNALLEDMAAKARGEPGLAQAEIDAHRATMSAQGPDSFAYDPKVPGASDPRLREERIRGDVATKGQQSKLVTSQKRMGNRSLQERPGVGDELPLPPGVKRGGISEEAGGVSFQNDPALQAERVSGPLRGQKPGPSDPALKKTFSRPELDRFVEDYLKSLDTAGDARTGSGRERVPPQRAGRALADPILELLSGQRRAGPQGSAAPGRPNINLQEMLRRIGLAA